MRGRPRNASAGYHRGYHRDRVGSDEPELHERLEDLRGEWADVEPVDAGLRIQVDALAGLLLVEDPAQLANYLASD